MAGVYVQRVRALEIYVRPFPNTGGQRQISTAGGMQPRWRSDGGELFFVAPDTQLMAAPIRFARDTRALDAGAPVPLFPSRLATGGNITSAGFQARAQYAVSADGRFLLNVAADGAVASQPIRIWDAALKKSIRSGTLTPGRSIRPWAAIVRSCADHDHPEIRLRHSRAVR